MSRRFAVLSLSFLMVGCEALWEEDLADTPGSEAAPVAVSAPAVESVPAPVVASVVAAAPIATGEARAKFSWDAPAPVSAPVVAPVVEAPRDPSSVRIIEIRESLGLVAFVRSEAPAVKSVFQLIKDGKVLVVEVASVNGTQVVANILPGQKNGAQLFESDVVAASALGSAVGR
jgi:hypothetical protein